MPVTDLWYLKKIDPDTGKPARSTRYGRGQRWEVRWIDPKTKSRRGKRFSVRDEATHFDEWQRHVRAEFERDTLTAADVLREEV